MSARRGPKSKAEKELMRIAQSWWLGIRAGDYRASQVADWMHGYGACLLGNGRIHEADAASFLVRLLECYDKGEACTMPQFPGFGGGE